MTRAQALDAIGKELSGARRAREEGNEGMVRVCARRAAGFAITFWLESNPRAGWGTDAISHLNGLQRDGSFPEEVRGAALRLTTKITEKFTTPFSTDPIKDCMIILTHLLHLNKPEAL